MGLGKTLMSLSLLQFLKHCGNYNGPHLVIVPKSTLVNWSREVERWTHLSVLSFHGNQAERSVLYDTLGTTDVCVTTYEMIIREKSQFKRTQWKYLIIDEAHRIKNEKSLLSRVVRTIPSEHRLLITGTPLQNNLHEMWALLNFLVPTLFSSSDDFDTWFDITDTQQQQLVIQRLHRILRPFLLRRLKSDVEKSLPPKTETKLFVALTAMQRQWYTKLLERDIELLNATAGTAGKTRLLNIVMQLRKVCNHPYLFYGAEPGPPFIEGDHIISNAGKMVLLDKLLSRLQSRGSRVLIFSQMTRMLDILEDYCRYREYDYCRIDGSTKHDERELAMDEFNAPNSKKFVFLLSTRAGGLGINLQTADTVIIYDSDWNPQMDLQAQDRAHRIGQKKPVFVYRFVTEQTVEQKIVERALKKLFLDTVVIKQGRLVDADKSMSASELQNMVKFGVQELFSGNNSDTTNTDDIDTILQRGATITSEEQNKLKTSFNNNLLSFDNTDEQSSLVFEGKDYRGIRNDNTSTSMVMSRFIEPTKRSRKTNYNESQYFHSALYGTSGEHKPLLKREYKPTQRYDFQFFNIARLDELERKEYESTYALHELRRKKRESEREQKRIKKEQEIYERRQQRRIRRIENNESIPTNNNSSNDNNNTNTNNNDIVIKNESDHSEPVESTTTNASSTTTDTVTLPLKQDSPEPATDGTGDASPEPDSDADDDDNESTQSNDNDDSNINNDDVDDSALRLEAGELTADEKQEKQELLDAGFADWSKRDFQLFIKSMEKHGRDDLQHIADAVNKSLSDVQKYHTVFWSKYKLIDNNDKLIQSIEKGEQRVRKLADIQSCITRKIERCSNNCVDDIIDSMTIQYPAVQKSYTELEDRFIIYALHQCGYSNWDDIKRMICRSYIFRFDWYIKSRTNTELSKRSEYLVKLLQKEDEQIKQKLVDEEKKQKAADARKKAAEKKKLNNDNNTTKSSGKLSDRGSGSKRNKSTSNKNKSDVKHKKSDQSSNSNKHNKSDKQSESIKKKSSTTKSTNKENKQSGQSIDTTHNKQHKRKSTTRPPSIDSDSDNDSLAVKKHKQSNTNKSNKHKSSIDAIDKVISDHKHDIKSKANKSHSHQDKSNKRIDTFFKKDSSAQSNDTTDDVQLLNNSLNANNKLPHDQQLPLDSNTDKTVSPSNKHTINIKKIPKKNEFTF